jgi:hypothetical protein
MVKSFIRLLVLTALAVVAAAPISASAATSSGMTLTVGSPITLQNKVLVTVPVTVTCVAPLSIDPTLVEPGFVNVSVQQAIGKTVSHGSGGIQLDSCSPTPETFLVQVVPDTTQPASGPFKHGNAILQATGELCDFNFPQTCYSATTDWTPIKV